MRLIIIIYYSFIDTVCDTSQKQLCHKTENYITRCIDNRYVLCITYYRHLQNCQENR